MRPLIAVITNLESDAHYSIPGYLRNTLNADYARSIAAAGGVPLLLPPQPDTTLLVEQLDAVAGLLLGGGSDVDPELYGQDPRTTTQAPQPLRDAYELAALRLARAKGIPVFGICRGLQFLNVALGGTLHQDNAETGTTLRHVGAGEPAHGLHSLTVVSGSFLTDAGLGDTRVNSFHHQCVDRVAPSLKVVARASDGIVEAVLHEREPLWAVQWHPEMMADAVAEQQALFDWFVARCV